jgi:hypothetical protein
MARPCAIGGTNPFGRFIVAVLAFAICTRGAAAGQISLTAVTRNQFAGGFDVTKPVESFMESSFSLKNGETAGVMRSEVFAGTGKANQGIYAYLYQVLAPSMTALKSFSIPGFDNGNTEATINGAKVASIFINKEVGAGAMSIDKFTVLGTVQPLRLDQSSVGDLFNYFDPRFANMGAPISAGATSFIVGIFSTLKPTTTDIVVTTVQGQRLFPTAYTTVPEPATLTLLGIGVIVLIVLRRHVGLAA